MVLTIANQNDITLYVNELVVSQAVELVVSHLWNYWKVLLL